MINKLQKVPADFQCIFQSLSDLAKEQNVRIYLVGGVVRDLMLGERIFDLDIVVEGDAIVFAHKFAQNQKKEFKKHHAFGTATVYFDNHHIDFVTARRETYSHSGALPKIKPASLREDLFRRDFTINAMAISLNKSDYGKLVNFYFGERDLRKHIIRTLHEKSFIDDPTRILRAIRFEQRFSFRIEKGTLKNMKEAIQARAFDCVNPHRLRDELIFILKEPAPFKYIKRLNGLGALYVIDKKIRLTRRDFSFLKKIETSILFYKKKFKQKRALDEWLIFLAAILFKLEKKNSLKFLESFGLHKGDRIRVLSIYDNIHRVKELNRPIAMHEVYKILNILSFESIIFFYAYFPQRAVKKNIEIFLNTLCNVRLKLKGEDLKKMGFKPVTFYGRIFEKLLYAKIDKGLNTINDEIAEAKNILENLSKNTI